MNRNLFNHLLLSSCLMASAFSAEPSPQQLANWLKRFPGADTNQDGKLTAQEANAYREKLIAKRKPGKSRGGAPRKFAVDPGWEAEKFPDHAVCYKTPEEIKSIYAEVIGGAERAVMSLPKPGPGEALRIVGTGHSFMAPGFRTMIPICKGAGLNQILHTHTGGGITGSTRYKWEQENGIFQFDGKPKPKLLASIANAEWDAMMWGPYFHDKPKYYSCWIDFCLKYNPDMKFYLSDAWLQLYQLETIPESENFFTEEIIQKMGNEKRDVYIKLVEALNKQYPGKVYILPTCDAMTLAARKFIRGELPGIEGFNRVIGKKEKSLWKDQLGHLGPGFDRLEGYVFYATLYGKPPELIGDNINFRGTGKFPGPELDKVFQKIAWEAVTNHHLSGVKVNKETADD